jgi:hypothetical protein
MARVVTLREIIEDYLRAVGGDEGCFGRAHAFTVASSLVMWGLAIRSRYRVDSPDGET